MNRRSPGHLFFALLGTIAIVMSAAQVSQRGVYAAKKQPVSHQEHVTYNQIAPIFYQHCSTCHHPGGAGPFSLLGYTAAKRWGMVIENVTQSRFMPPWLPAPGYGDFAHDRRLPDKDLQLIKEWVAEGMPEGNPKDAPKPPVYTSKWVLGPPDLILKVTSPTTIPPSGPDVFINFVLPVPIKRTRYVRALQIIPGSPRVVHHCNIIIDRTDSMRRAYPHTWQKGIPGMEFTFDSGDAFEPDSHFLFWKPDTPALIEPKGMPWRIDPGNDLVLNTHFKPTGKVETAQAEVGLYFTDKPPIAHPMLIQLEHDAALNIPPGDSHFVIQDQLTLPVDVDVLGVYPHAHYLGKKLEGWAILPNGKKEWLILIRDWDIDRQSVYTYKKPVFLPRGTVLHMRYIYDNSSGNIRNPNSPPIRVRAGNQSTDEMGHLWFQVLPHPLPGSKEDPRLLLEKAWMDNQLRKDANDQTALYNLAYVDRAEGDLTGAESLYQRLLVMKPNDPRSMTALGTAFDAAGDWKQAEDEFEKAVAADPTYADAHYDLAELDYLHDHYPDAAQEYKSLLSGHPNDAAAHNGLGTVLLAMNETSDARQQFETTIALDPDNFDALYNLAVIESQSNELAEAEVLLQRALKQKNDADAHQLLGNLYAQDGQMADALQQFKAVAALHPKDPLPHREIAEADELTGDLSSAIRELNAALALDSTNADDWNNLGVVEARNGDRAAARKDFERALSLDPNHAAARANLAKL